MSAHFDKRCKVKGLAVYCSAALITIAALLFLFSCSAGVNIGEADRVLTAFSIEWPAGFENQFINGVPVPVTIKALDQHGETFTSWSGNVSIENENSLVSVDPPTVFVSNGSKQVSMIFTVTEQQQTRIRVWYNDTSSPWCAYITVQKIFSITTEEPLDGSFLTGHQEIVIPFNEAADSGSLLLGGDLGPVAVEAWSTSTYENDTLILTPPVDFWPEGNSKTLTIQCDSLAGGQQVNESLSYDVLHGMFVSAQNSSDSNPGTADKPKRTIQGAITGVVSEGYTTAEIHVAEGNYAVDWETEEAKRIEMVEGVSLYGGYWIDDWHVRNPSSYTTTIEDTSTDGGSQYNPTRAIYCEDGITTATIIDGFTIKGGAGSYSAAVFCKDSGSPTITNNIINGGDGSTNSYGIHCYGGATKSSPHILNNTIDGGSGTDSSCGIYINTSDSVIEDNNVDGGTSSGVSYGVRADAGNKGFPVIKKNMIYGGGGGTESYGIYNFYNDSKIWNNVIHGGGGDCTYGIYIEPGLPGFPEIRNNTINGGSPRDGDMPDHIPYCIYSLDSQPAVDNNMIFASIDMYAYGYYEQYESFNPTSFNNNNIFYCNTLYYQTNIYDLNSIDDINALGFADANISEDIRASLDSEFRFTGNLSEVFFDTSGIDGSSQEPAWGFTDDKDEVPRTGDGSIGWSIGAYEYNE